MKKAINKLPQNPGVYFFFNEKEKIIYIGKAANLRRRVGSYFSSAADKKTRAIAQETKRIEFKETDTVIEALIKEAEAIKRYKPRYNIKEKDDRSFLYVVITKEEYPRVLLKRGRERKETEERNAFGPFTSSGEIRQALRVIRKIFPYSTHTKREIKKNNPCFYYQINLCPGTCVGDISKKEYLEEIKNIELFFKGRKKRIISKLKKEMKMASDNLRFEKAQELKRKIGTLSYIQDTALIMKKEDDEGKTRIEGYDISNISGTLAMGSMVVFKGSLPQKSEYRVFKIRNVIGPDDTGMIKEVLKRRLQNDWALPHLVLIDGGKGQVNTAKEVLDDAGLSIPVVGIAKGKKRKAERMIGKIPFDIKKETLLKVRDEAHRFALRHHRNLRGKQFSS